MLVHAPGRRQMGSISILLRTSSSRPVRVTGGCAFEVGRLFTRLHESYTASIVRTMAAPKSAWVQVNVGAGWAQISASVLHSGKKERKSTSMNDMMKGEHQGLSASIMFTVWAILMSTGGQTYRSDQLVPRRFIIAVRKANRLSHVHWHRPRLIRLSLCVWLAASHALHLFVSCYCQATSLLLLFFHSTHSITPHPNFISSHSPSG